jgi:glycosyltransferase involved in cell wall biosynthesis
MACGTQVIGSNVGGINITVDEGKTGFLVPPHSPKALAEGIENLIANEKLLSSMQHNSVKRVNKYFTWKSVANSCHELYEKIIRINRKEVRHTSLINIDNFNFQNAGMLLKDPFYLTHNIPALNE